MLSRKWICLSLLIVATLLTPVVVGHGSIVTKPQLRADGGAPPPPPPWPTQQLSAALHIS
jgi:hypothetical protein